MVYAGAHMGAVQLHDPAAVDDVFMSLRALTFPREDEGESFTIKLHEFQIIALANLNPASLAATRALVPSMQVYSDEEVNEALAVLRRASGKYAGLEASVG